MQIKQLWDFALGCLYPPRCLFCGKVISPGCQCCPACEKSVQPVYWRQLMAQPQTENSFLCLAPDLYGGNIRKAMIAFKFHGRPKYASFFAHRMFQQLEQEQLLHQIDWITCVPLSASRRKKRGYNQSERIAKELSCLSKLPYRPALEKTVDNQEQHQLHKKARRSNVQGVYRALPTAQIGMGRILLVDDIITTGATLGECADVLYSAGAQRVICAAAARVPLEILSG